MARRPRKRDTVPGAPYETRGRGEDSTGSFRWRSRHCCMQDGEVCTMCDAKLFPCELSKSKKAPGNSGFCCLHGRVPPVAPMSWAAIMRHVPPVLLDYRDWAKAEASDCYRKSARWFNGMLSMTSTGVRHAGPPGRGVGNFCIQGRMYHRVGCTLRDDRQRRPTCESFCPSHRP